ncbi:CBS domain-containing protein [Coprobacter tertius]|uniref:CBS domain-containing protein n=1 Tax=Coprobacter tertius TaxID=2944915 RepID=A0ABT1MIX0_9BACT|nr:CBS domain-containing protein [Coprobacter tertius]MCP9612575.1 CBS domain-containing protein [Coprobacter tertius]
MLLKKYLFNRFTDANFKASGKKYPEKRKFYVSLYWFTEYKNNTIYSNVGAMTAKDLISNDIPVLYPETTVTEALARLEETRLGFLPVVKGEEYIGMASEKMLLETSDAEQELGNLILSAPSVKSESHLFDVLNQMTQLSVDMMPVTTQDGHYLGSVDRKNLLKHISTICNTGQEGAVILLEMYPEDYSLSELARLVEDNNCKIMNLLTYPYSENGMLRISIKIDCVDASPVLRSLERFNYKIVCCYQQQGVIDETLRQRFNELMYYLEM